MSQRDLHRDPHDPGAEPRSTDPIQTNDASAVGQLAALLRADRDGAQPNYTDPEESVESEADAEDAPINWGIVIPLAVIVAAVVGWGLAAPDNFSNFADTAFGWVIDNLGWAFVLGGTIFVAFVIVIALSGFGRIRLGSADERPEFKTTSWIAMMFAAGMGIGLMFYGASEPLAMYLDGVPGHNEHEVGTAMAQTMFHWTTASPCSPPSSAPPAPWALARCRSVPDWRPPASWTTRPPS